MSETRDNGGPAHPATIPTGIANLTTDYPGMSLRDWFAGQALAGIAEANWRPERYDWMSGPECWARCAYDLADEMLKARDK